MSTLTWTVKWTVCLHACSVRTGIGYFQSWYWSVIALSLLRYACMLSSYWSEQEGEVCSFFFSSNSTCICLITCHFNFFHNVMLLIHFCMSYTFYERRVCFMCSWRVLSIRKTSIWRGWSPMALVNVQLLTYSHGNSFHMGHEGIKHKQKKSVWWFLGWMLKKLLEPL